MNAVTTRRFILSNEKYQMDNPLPGNGCLLKVYFQLATIGCLLKDEQLVTKESGHV